MVTGYYKNKPFVEFMDGPERILNNCRFSDDNEIVTKI